MTSPTAAGQASTPTRPAPGDEHIDAINQVFALFRVNYHNQYHAAYSGDAQLLNQAKRLWLDTLSVFSPEQILHAAKSAIEQSEYLPTLNRMISLCNHGPVHGMPDTYNAYIEACRAPSPKAEYPWSHPAVYHAGLASDWYFLATQPESRALPVFERNYSLVRDRFLNGEDLSIPLPKAIEKDIARPLSREEQKEKLAELKKALED